MNPATVVNPVEREALTYLEDQAYSALLGFKEPVRSAEIIGAIGKEAYSSKLIRHALAASKRFANIDRKWDIEVRYEDKQRPMERVLREIIAEYGCPMSVEQMANEISSVYQRPADYYETIIPRMVSNEDRFFRISGGLYGLNQWLLEVTSDSEDDIIFDNDIDAADVKAAEKASAKVNLSSDDLASVVVKILDAAKSPLSGKAISLLRWRALGESFDSVADYDKLFGSDDLVWLSDGRWASKKMTKQYDTILVESADKLAEEILEEAPKSVVEKAEVAANVAPTLSLNISDRDLDEVAQIVSSRGVGKMPLILDTIFVISPSDPIYAVAAEGLSDTMRADPRFTWAGSERWRMAETVPDNINTIPAAFEIKKYHFETPEGEPIDIELEDEGLEGGLEVEIRNPLVQDVYDRDEITEQDKLPPTDSARCVLTRHHKLLGTFPLAQIPNTFFAVGPHLQEVTFVSGDKQKDVWVNRETGLIYNMGSWYSEEMHAPGAIFNLVKTGSPDEFTFEYDGTTDPLVFINQNRVDELVELASDPTTENMSTYDLMSELMQDHRKGVPFVTLFTEVNLVRRTTRRLVASILSSYYAFYQKPKSALWHFDEKKANQGFKKAKRKYVRKEQ